MKTRWIIAAAAALALAVLTLPLWRARVGTANAPTSPVADAEAAAHRPATCTASGKAKLDFVLKDMDGHAVRLADFKGKVIALNFWATWCGPCKIEIPEFVELYDKYKDKGFVILGVSIDDPPDALRAFAHQYDMRYPILQMQSDIEDAYGPIYGVPMTFFIGRDGSICTRHLGPATKEQFEREIRSLL
ncbi:MAG TPA: TlpA disulfide reductase family protein [Vicinamibacterales bacterium]|nr:TlpA disulfide reductase family protein [Vicinamibacterales bacterium]